MDAEVVTRTALYTLSAPAIVALVQLVKGLGCPDRFAPLVALALGLLAAFGAVAAVPLPPQHPFVTVLIGLGMGLTAAGLYSGTRTVLKV
jgi:hypothetical protein